MPKGYVWDDRLGQPRHEATGQFGEKPKPPKASRKSSTKGKAAESGSKGNEPGTPNDEIAPGVPRKPERLPDEDWLKGRKAGGSVNGALEVARRYARGGVVVGPIVGATGGRSDKLPVDVESGSYVLPADVVSALGEGNSLAGHKAIEQMFGKGAASNGEAIGIKISDGEHVLARKQVEQAGRGDYEQGCRTLDAFAKMVRAQNIKKLQSLPPPAA